MYIYIHTHVYKFISIYLSFDMYIYIYIYIGGQPRRRPRGHGFIVRREFYSTWLTFLASLRSPAFSSTLAHFSDAF